jgi:hypothetical protein
MPGIKIGASWTDHDVGGCDTWYDMDSVDVKDLRSAVSIFAKRSVVPRSTHCCRIPSWSILQTNYMRKGAYSAMVIDLSLPLIRIVLELNRENCLVSG